jgi:hypothetical protein
LVLLRKPGAVDGGVEGKREAAGFQAELWATLWKAAGCEYHSLTTTVIQGKKQISGNLVILVLFCFEPS